MTDEIDAALDPKQLKRRKAQRLLAERKRRTLRIRQRVAAIGATLAIATYGMVAFTDTTASTTVASTTTTTTTTDTATPAAESPDNSATTSAAQSVDSSESATGSSSADETATTVTTQAS